MNILMRGLIPDDSSILKRALDMSARGTHAVLFGGASFSPSVNLWYLARTRHMSITCFSWQRSYPSLQKTQQMIIVIVAFVLILCHADMIRIHGQRIMV
jgi:hypothetical protein